MRGRGAAAHRVAHVADGAPRGLVLGQFEQDRQRAVQRLSGAEQGRQLLGELHQTLAGERLRLQQRPPRWREPALRRQPRLDRQVALLLQPLRDVRVAGRIHLPLEHLAAGIERLVSVEGHQ